MIMIWKHNVVYGGHCCWSTVNQILKLKNAKKLLPLGSLASEHLPEE